MAALALEREGTWHLVYERCGWAEALARRVRALMHDINNLTKYPGAKMPAWLLPFVAVHDVGDSPPAPPTPPAPPPPTASPVTPEPLPATTKNDIRFAWDEELMAAYMHIPGKARDYCKNVIADGNDEDDEVVVWADGTRWKVPVVTVGEWNKPRVKSVLEIYESRDVDKQYRRKAVLREGARVGDHVGGAGTEVEEAIVLDTSEHDDGRAEEGQDRLLGALVPLRRRRAHGQEEPQHPEGRVLEEGGGRDVGGEGERAGDDEDQAGGGADQAGGGEEETSGGAQQAGGAGQRVAAHHEAARL